MRYISFRFEQKIGKLKKYSKILESHEAKEKHSFQSWSMCNSDHSDDAKTFGGGLFVSENDLNAQIQVLPTKVKIWEIQMVVEAIWHTVLFNKHDVMRMYTDFHRQRWCTRAAVTLQSQRDDFFVCAICPPTVCAIFRWLCFCMRYTFQTYL